MFKTISHSVVFLAGLAAVCWIGAGYLGSNPLGVCFALLIGACYVAGALELYRYRQATASLALAMDDAGAAQTDLGGWLQRLDPSLRNAVRLRIEGERVALPAPGLTPYLVGLLVLLGMLGTFLGMMATLRGTGLALESATDLQAIRDSLAAPVKGLGFAFGTSIAGVATSAMLGLLAALCRRERAQAVQALDLQIATTLHPHSQAFQRAEAFKLLQRQTELMPALIDRLQAMATGIEQQGLASGERLASHQDAFHTRTEAAYTRLAAALEQSLQAGVAENARALGAALQPVVEATLAGLARETVALHEQVGQAVQRQLDGLSAGFDKAAEHASHSWEAALAEQRGSNQALVQDLRGALQAAGDGFAARSSGLLDAVSARLDATADAARQAWTDALAHQEALNDRLATRNGQALDAIALRLDSAADGATQAWNAALSRQDAINAALAERNAQALSAAAAVLEERAASLLERMQQSHAHLQDALQARDEARLATWAATFATLVADLNAEAARNDERLAQRQQAICDTLERTAGAIAAQTQEHASATIAEISRLVQTASAAPKAAADVVAELRQTLSESMVRDTAMLEERSRLLETLHTLLEAVNHASTEQRAAVDALVTTSADLLDRVGTRFSDHLEAETGKLGEVAAQVAAGATEVASLGDALGGAVDAFGHANAALVERLQGIEQALDKSLARSDEQLAYYVAQAREVIDLSLLSQKQIIEELRQLPGHHAHGGADAA
jgi:Small-conductance mechanosensitive channel